MAVSGSRARVVHAVRGRMRVRLEDGVSDTPLNSLGVVRGAPGVQAVDVRATARSIVIRYDPRQNSEDAVLAALAQAGIDILPASPEPVVAAGHPSRETTSETAATPQNASTCASSMVTFYLDRLNNQRAGSSVGRAGDF